MENRLTRVALALSAYKSDRNTYPASLGELAPDYLPDVPHDVFCEKPLIYAFPTARRRHQRPSAVKIYVNLGEIDEIFTSRRGFFFDYA